MTYAPYDEHAVNEDLNENMADDPFGTAQFLIRNAMSGAFRYAEHMSEYEHTIVLRLARLFVALDPYSRCPLCGSVAHEGVRDGYIDFDPGDPEVGPQPDVAPCYVCNLEKAKEAGWEE